MYRSMHRMLHSIFRRRGSRGTGVSVDEYYYDYILPIDQAWAALDYPALLLSGSQAV